MACLHSNWKMTGQSHCPRTNRHRPTSVYDHELAIPKTEWPCPSFKQACLGLSRGNIPQAFVYSLLHLVYSSSPYDTTSQQCNDFLKCVERSCPCAFRWSLKLSPAAHILRVKAGAPKVSATILHWLLFTFSKPPWGDPHMCGTGYQSCSSPEMLLCVVKLLLLGNSVRKAAGLESSSANSHQGSAWRYSFFQREEVKRTASAVETSLFLTKQGASYPDTTAGLLTLKMTGMVE